MQSLIEAFVVSTSISPNTVGGWTARRVWSDGFFKVVHENSFERASTEIEKNEPEHSRETLSH